MDVSRRAELEQEKAKLLIELEAVAASHAVWEKAFQKATLEQERIKKEEQQLIQRRDMLRLLVDAASDQAYRAEEDYRKLRAEGPLIDAAKAEEMEQIRSLKQLVLEKHADTVSSFQEIIMNFANAPWIQMLKKKENQRAQVKREVEKEEAVKVELAADLAKFRELIDDDIDNPTCAVVAEMAALEQRLALLRVQKDEEHRMAMETQIFNSPNRRRSDGNTPQKRGQQAELPVMHGTPNPIVRRTPSRPNLLANRGTPGSAKKATVVNPMDIIQPTPSPPPKRRSQQSQRSDTSLLIERQREEVSVDSQSPSQEEETGDQSYAEHHNNSTQSVNNGPEAMEVDHDTSSPDSEELQEGNGSQESTNGDVVADSDPDAASFHFNLTGNTTNSAAPRSSSSPVFAVPELPERFQIQNSNKKKNQNPSNRNSSVEADMNASAGDGDGNSDFFNILENETAGGDDDDSAVAFSFLNSQSSNTQHSTDGGFNFNFDDDDNNDDNNGGGSGGFFF